MSALVVAINADGIIAACDGACYQHETGAISAFVSKIILLPEYGALIGWTGVGNFGPALRWEINQAISSFDDLVNRFEAVCKHIHGEMFGDNLGPMTEVSCVIAGWSEARRAYEGYRLVSYEKQSIGFSNERSIAREPFKSVPLPAAIWSSFSPTKMDDFGLNPPAEDEETLDVAIRLVCAARADSGWLKDKDGTGDNRLYMAGGFVQVAVLQQYHVQSWIAHRWPEDTVGHRVDPSKGAPLPPWLEMKNASP